MRYCDSKVWLRVTGGGVIGWDLIEINAKIDEFNAFPWAAEADFFQWLSWNSRLMSYVHPIRSLI